MTKSRLNALVFLFMFSITSIGSPTFAAEVGSDVLCKISLLGKDPVSVQRALDILDEMYGMFWLERDTDPKNQASPTRSMIFSVQEGWAPMTTFLKFDWREMLMNNTAARAYSGWSASRLGYPVEPEVETGLYKARYLAAELLNLVLKLSEDKGARFRGFLTMHNNGTNFGKVFEAIYSQKTYSKEELAKLLLGWIAPTIAK